MISLTCFRKIDYIHLAKIFKNDPDFIVMHISDYRRNPLIPPPGVSFSNWVQIDQAAFRDTHKLERSVRVMSNHARRLHEAGGKQLNLYGLYKSIVENMPPRSSGEYIRYYKFLEVLQSLLDTLPDTFACQQGFLNPDFLRKRIVLVIDIINEHSRFVVTDFWQYVFHYRKANCRQNIWHPHMVIVIDEYQAIAGIQNFSMVDNLVIDELYRMSRGFDIGFVGSTQQSRKLTDTVRATAGTNIITGISDDDELSYMADSMGLDGELRDKARKLERPEHIVKKQSGFQDPILIESPDFPLVKDLVMDQARQMTYPNFFMGDKCPVCGGKLRKAKHAYQYIGTDVTEDLFADCLSCGRSWACTNSAGAFAYFLESVVVEVRKILNLSDEEVDELDAPEWYRHRDRNIHEFRSQIRKIDQRSDEERRKRMTDEDWKKYCERKKRHEEMDSENHIEDIAADEWREHCEQKEERMRKEHENHMAKMKQGDDDICGMESGKWYPWSSTDGDE